MSTTLDIASETTRIDLALLRESMNGTIVLPGDYEWDSARQTYNLAIDQHPTAIAFPADVEDVQRVVVFAARGGLEVAAQWTGHNAAPLGDLEGVILVRTDALDEVTIDPEAMLARVGSGVKWESVLPPVSDLGLAVLHGSTPDVSITGYGLGGGIGWYARKHGLFTNSITAIELVTADGRHRRVDHENEPELFWALRGGGGSFGVVTALEFRLFPISEVYAGILFYPWEKASEVLHAWREWTDTVPDEMTSLGRILQFPPMEELPEHLRGRSFVVVEAFFLGTADEGDELLAPLRALEPEFDTVELLPPIGLAEIHMDPPDPLPYVGQGILLADLPPAAIDELVEVAGPDSGSTLVSVEIRHTGGALSRGAADHGALNTLPGSFLAFAVGMTFTEEMANAAHADVMRVGDVLGPHRGGAYLNFEEDPTDPAIFFGRETYARLREIKAMVDPDELIRGNHPIPPAADERR